jgi:hypothetical protein
MIQVLPLSELNHCFKAVQTAGFTVLLPPLIVGKSDSMLEGKAEAVEVLLSVVDVASVGVEIVVENVVVDIVSVLLDTESFPELSSLLPSS